MANRGFLLANAGFLEEALELANRANTYAEPHVNVYSLFEHIERIKGEHKEKWEKLIESANKWQNYVRIFVGKYYHANKTNIVGKWRVGGSENMATASVSGEDVKIVAPPCTCLLDRQLHPSSPGGAQRIRRDASLR